MIMEAIDGNIAIAIAILLRRRRRRRRDRVVWVRPWLDRRERLGAFTNLVHELRTEDVTEFTNFLRLEPRHFDFLLEAVKPAIEKQNTFMRRCIPAAERLAVTLRFLASGDSYTSLSYLYRISRQTLGTIIPETCQAIYDALKSTYVQVPQTEAEWDTIAEEFKEMWQFPNCIGAMDGKHIALKAPNNSGSTYYNYKHFHSIILLAVVDAHYKFVMFDLGVNGRNSDAGVFANSSIAKGMEQNTLHIPAAKHLPDWHDANPHVFVGDEAFPLKHYLLKPYPGRGVTCDEKIFNYRLSRARRVSENAFGILINRFAVLGNKIILNPDVATTVALACIALHNYLRTVDDAKYAQRVERLNRPQCVRQIGAQGGRRNAKSARDVRDDFRDYFNSVGAVCWQWQE